MASILIYFFETDLSLVKGTQECFLLTCEPVITFVLETVSILCLSHVMLVWLSAIFAKLTHNFYEKFQKNGDALYFSLFHIQRYLKYH